MSTSVWIEFVDDDDSWLSGEAGERAADVVEVDEQGVETSRTRTLVAYEAGSSRDEWREFDDLAQRRSIARDAPVIVIGFSAGGSAQLLDVDVDADGGLVYRMDVPRGTLSVLNESAARTTSTEERMPPTKTVRECLEAICDRHTQGADLWDVALLGICNACEQRWPCPDRQDAEAALDVLEQAPRFSEGEVEQARVIRDPETYPPLQVLRLWHPERAGDCD